MTNEHRNKDISLLQRIQEGDDLAIALLYDRYSCVVYSIALRVLHDAALAEQVLLDIFAAIWRSPARFLQIVDSFSASLAMIARNRAVAISLHQPESMIDFAAPPWIAGIQHRKMTCEQARAAIDKLPMQYRLMLERAFFHGANQLQFSGLTGRPAQTDDPLAVSEAVSRLADTGLEVIDLQTDAAFAQRQLHVHNAVSHIEGMDRLSRVFVESPATLLQELVTAAVDLCGADSAGISIETKNGTDDNFYHWVATAGQCSGLVNATLPRYPSACGVTLERGRPQIFRVAQRFFDLMGVQAPTVTDGMLLPWQVEETRGTIWIMAHGRNEAFDTEDCRMMQALADFAATGVRLQQQSC